MKKHVVLLKSKASLAGGLEKSASRIISAFVERGTQVSVLTTGKTPPNQPQVSFYSAKTWSWPPFLRIEQFDRFTKKWIQHHGADLVFGMDRNREQTHIRAGNGVHDAYLQSRRWTEGRLKELSCRLNPMHRKILQLEKTAFENPLLRKIFANSHMVRKQILERYKVDPTKIEVIHNGVEWNEMQKDFAHWASRKESLLEQFSLPSGVFHFLFVGSGYLRKGLGQLLIGLSRLPTRDFHLSVIGKDRRMEEYISKTHLLGLSKHVRFFGPQADIRPFYQLADALVIPSFYDPFANVTVEALAMGLFVLSSHQNGGHEIITPQNGICIESLLDPEAMTQALATALQYPKNHSRAQIIRNSVEYLDFSIQLDLLMKACLE
ncbi:MAG: glycosyltransferase family 4 protein [Chlamydiales bacterium]|nr:glycosyltransferase family 4 protein [Chlamydiales bacterium]